MQPGQQQIGEEHPEHDEQQHRPAGLNARPKHEIGQPDRRQTGEGEQYAVHHVRDRWLPLADAPDRHEFIVAGLSAQGQAGRTAAERCTLWSGPENEEQRTRGRVWRSRRRTAAALSFGRTPYSTRPATGLRRHPALTGTYARWSTMSLGKIDGRSHWWTVRPSPK